MNSDKLFKGTLIALGLIVVVSIVVIFAVTRTSSSPTKSDEKAEDYIAGITKKYPFQSTPTNDLLKADAVWNKNMDKGDGGKKLVVYSDLYCPYCAKEANAARDAKFDKEYMDSGRLNYEIRVTDTLAMGSDRPSVNSTRGGEAIYCAADQGKFWEYYYKMLDKIKADYYDKGIGGYHGAPEIPKIDDSYYFDGAKDIGVDVAKMTKCMNDGTGLKKLRVATDSALRTNRNAQGKGNGLPAIFVDGKFVSAGFGEGGFEDFKKMLTAAGV
jgi:hypothetical protein